MCAKPHIIVSPGLNPERGLKVDVPEGRPHPLANLNIEIKALNEALLLGHCQLGQLNQVAPNEAVAVDMPDRTAAH